MPKRVVSLTDLQIEKAKKQEKPYKLTDGAGLYLLITPTGGKLWNLKYQFAGKERKLSLGQYPAVSLAEARRRKEDAQNLLANDQDPAAIMSKQAKKQQQTAVVEAKQIELESTFEHIARAWHNKFSSTWTAHHATRIMTWLERDVFPYIGGMDIATIEAPDILAVLERIANRPALDQAHRTRSHCGMVFRYAIGIGKVKRDPTRDLFKILPPVNHGHRAAPTDPKEVAALLRAIDDYSGSYVVQCALKLLPMLFCRPGELRGMEWAELDLDAAEWSIPAARMKMKQAHLVPLPTQAIEIIKTLQPLTGGSKLVFPSSLSDTRCISENTLNTGLRRMGIEKHELSSHGWRAVARTLLHEVLGFTPDAIEAQLAHAVPDRLGRAYNRTTHIQERRRMMQHWSDYLDGLKAGAKVIPITKAA
ncbi:MAG: integrase arm-type DNA-binding domain-containing protein [Trichlorobacter sp.]|uniref:tyrosine-type recombinase/integrase n=1 Tax=Trichlorobacter sp. TaxID=2911007 RepID=UPI00256281AF|nr:integrase arm-type DNA-binding domain-containing protein [Trichlorobacter sp.]MDK9717948.1 integrase arm-type DNA-binding domain-containing protein [Trichlorobacter sp.]